MYVDVMDVVGAVYYKSLVALHAEAEAEWRAGCYAENGIEGVLGAVGRLNGPERGLAAEGWVETAMESYGANEGAGELEAKVVAAENLTVCV